MSERLNRTSICSVIFLDIIGYSEKSVSKQIEEKDQFNTVLSEAIKNIAQNDRIILDTGDGAAIALLGAPEEAIFVALSIRDNISKMIENNTSTLGLRCGINLGPVRVMNDINGHLNIIGDGINVAQRVMSFAEPNQILVSRSYYEVTSRLSNEFTSMFSYSGLRQDKHIREHEVYEIRDTSIQATEAEIDLVSSPTETTGLLLSKKNFAGLPLYFVLSIGLLGAYGWHAYTSPTATAPKPPVSANSQAQGSIVTVKEGSTQAIASKMANGKPIESKEVSAQTNPNHIKETLSPNEAESGKIAKSNEKKKSKKLKSNIPESNQNTETSVAQPDHQPHNQTQTHPASTSVQSANANKPVISTEPAKKECTLEERALFQCK